jgi:zinc transport system substrate-binding protein
MSCSGFIINNMTRILNNYHKTSLFMASMNKRQKLLVLGATIFVISLIAVVSSILVTEPASDKLKVVVTFYPLAFLSQEIGGDHVQVTQLVPSNTEIHSWEPSASHIASAEKADVIAYNGAGLDHWMETEILSSLSSSKNRACVNTSEGLELLSSESEDREHGLCDPHTWVSPYMAKLQAEKIYSAFVQKDSAHASYYAERWLNLKGKLEQLDSDYSAGLSAKQKNATFVTHEAFGYLAHRYGFEQHGVIGLSADEQPSGATIAKLVNLMIERETFVVYVDPVYSDEYAQTLKNELQTQTGNSVQVLKLYLMLGPIDGRDYLEQMRSNLDSLKIGLEAT